MDILYIGHYSNGSTSRMRGEYLKELLPVKKFTLVNVDVPLYQTNRVFRSIGWHFRKGPLITKFNAYLLSVIKDKWKYDLVWVDKGVFIKPEIIQKLASHSKMLVHFTPDPAFTYHKSKLFFEAIKYYDYCITSKLFEIESYYKQGAKNVITCTQGYHPDIHKPYYSFEEKEGVVFIGHHEKNREIVVEEILKEGISLTLAGVGWKSLVKKWNNSPHLHYLGDGVFADEYAKVISKALIGLGFLSKIIPEEHTTRTLEIPACGTVLLTESTRETRSIFTEDEVVFFNNPEEIVEILKHILDDKPLLESISSKGIAKVVQGGYDYKSIIVRILNEMNLSLSKQGK